MKTRAARLSLLLCGALALAACSSGPGGPRGMGRMGMISQVANPGEIVALELGMARMIREEGQAKAFEEYAADDAIMFVPQPVHAKDWLKHNSLPPSPVSSDPVKVWSSCDGSMAVAKGVWRRENGAAGWYINVWQRQEDGAYRWVLADGGALDAPASAPEMVQADIAQCDQKPSSLALSIRNLDYRKEGASKDRSLSYHVDGHRDGSRSFSLLLWKDGEHKSVLEQASPAIGGPGKP